MLEAPTAMLAPHGLRTPAAIVDLVVAKGYDRAEAEAAVCGYEASIVLLPDPAAALIQRILRLRDRPAPRPDPATNPAPAGRPARRGPMAAPVSKVIDSIGPNPARRQEPDAAGWRSLAKAAHFPIAVLGPPEREILSMLARTCRNGWGPRDRQDRTEIALMPKLLAKQSRKRAADPTKRRRAYTDRSYRRAVAELAALGLIVTRTGPHGRRIARLAGLDAWVTAASKCPPDVHLMSTWNPAQPLDALGANPDPAANGITALRLKRTSREALEGIPAITAPAIPPKRRARRRTVRRDCISLKSQTPDQIRDYGRDFFCLVDELVPRGVTAGLLNTLLSGASLEELVPLLEEARDKRNPGAYVRVVAGLRLGIDHPSLRERSY